MPFEELQSIMNALWLEVPIMRAHAESINLEFEKPLSEEQALKLLADFPGVTVLDDRTANRCPRVLPHLVSVCSRWLQLATRTGYR